MDDWQAFYLIGQFCFYDQCVVLKEDGSISSEFIGSGEFLVSGVFVMAGYFGMLEQICQVMVEYEEWVWYKIGDLVEVDLNGDFLYCGCWGRMVK